MTAALTVLGIAVLAHRFRPRPARTDFQRASRSKALPRLAAAAVSLRERRAARSRPPASAVAAWCDQLARAIRAGDTLRAALVHVAPADPSVRIATDPIRALLERGRSVADAASELGHSQRSARAHRSPPAFERPDHLGLATSVIAVCGRLGGSAAAPLDRVAAALRQRAADDQERAAQSAQARLSAHVLTLVPLAVLSLLVLTDPAVRAALATPPGSLCVTGGMALNASGWIWMRAIVRGAHR